ncbi:hypothetical protein FACS189429_4410 [Bacteroidia bacterium]|nr:hypothetical protein FACS189429_4410 [Bacteroidia bacterium]GHV45165.1 hypothetical protein FACS1894180_7400 [Bacteroidia bacterium]
MVYDRGGKGKTAIKGVKITIPSVPKTSDSLYEKTKKRIKCRDRAAIEPINSHLKHSFRMLENCPGGEAGHTNQRLDGSNCVEFEEKDGKIDRNTQSKNFALYFSAVFSTKITTLLLPRCVKMGLLRDN